MSETELLAKIIVCSFGGMFAGVLAMVVVAIGTMLWLLDEFSTEAYERASDWKKIVIVLHAYIWGISIWFSVTVLCL